MRLKNFFVSVLVVASIFLCVATCGCAKNGGQTATEIVSIEKTSTVGLKDYYTITYNDGSTFVFEITNGSDGKDLNIDEVYEFYLEQNPNGTYQDFLKCITSTSVNPTISTSNKALLSSLKVYSEFTESYISGIGPFQQKHTDTAIYCGSAVIYAIEDDYTYMITNYHVLYDSNASGTSKLAKKINCYLYGSESMPSATTNKDDDGCTIYDYGEYAIECEYVGGSITNDLAVIKTKTTAIKSINDQICSVEFADGYHVGQSAIAIGNSEDEGISVTDGIVSVDNEFITYAIDNTTRAYRSLRIDTAIYGGNSGGGLFNGDGELIGITNAGDGESQNINFAIPVNIVKPVVENIIAYQDGTVKKITLGITPISENSKYSFNPILGYGEISETVKVGEVSNGSIAQTMGLKSGQILTALNINDKSFPIKRYFDINDLLYTVRAGDEISFEYKMGDITVSSTAYTVLESDLKVV